MKRINKLKKFPDGGTTNKAAAATETRNFDNITPIVDPQTGAVNWNLYNTALNAYPQGYNNTDPTKKNPNEVNIVNYYVGQTIVPAIKTRQEVLNAAYAKKYGKTYDPKNPNSFQPTEDQYLSPKEANKALQAAKLGTYDDYLQYSNAYNQYRSKTQIAGTNTQGTQEDPNAPQNYGIRHYNLFVPGYTAPANNTQQPQQPAQNQPLPQKSLGGIMGDLGNMNFNKAGELAGNYGKAMADSTLSMIGLSNVIPDTAYKGAGSDFGKVAGVTGSIGKAVLPMALGAAGVPPQVTMAAQKAIGSFNPQDKQQFPDGGIKNSNNPNAELEKKEVFQMPNGETDQVNGPTHENGGVPVNIPEGTRIWSDRLKKDGKTFAKLAAKYKTDKEDKILKDTNSSRRSIESAKLNSLSKNIQLNKLFNEQESLKQKKINNYIKKYGGTQKYPNGGYIEGSFDDPNILPASQDEVNAQMLNNIQMKYPQFNAPEMQSPYQWTELTENTNLPPLDVYDTDLTPGYNPNFPSKSPQPQLKTPDVINQVNQLPEQKSSIVGKMIRGYNENKDKINNIGGQAALFGLNNIGNLSYLINEGKDYDKVNYGSVSPELMTDRDSVNQINRSYNTALYNMKNTGNMRQSGQVALAGEKMKQTANAKERIANVNTGIKNQFNQYNKELQVRGMQDEAANKGEAYTNYYSALGSIGQNVALQTRDYKQQAMDQKKLNLVKDIFPDYQFDPKTLNYMYKMYKLASKQSGI